MKLTTDDARAAARDCNKIWVEHGNGREYTEAIENTRYLVASNKEMTEQEKRDFLWTFEHSR